MSAQPELVSPAGRGDVAVYAVLRIVGLLLAVAGSGLFLLLQVTGSVISLRSLYAEDYVPVAASSSLGEALAAPAVWLFLAVFALAGAALAGGAGGIGLVREPVRPTLWRIAAMCAVLTTLIVGVQLVWAQAAHWWPALGGPAGVGGVEQVGDALTATWSWSGLLVAAVVALGAGLGEEVCALAVPVWLAQQAGLLQLRVGQRPVGMWVVAGALVAARVVYHLYLGPVALALLPWSVGTVLLYLRMRRLAPFVAAHFLYDFINGALSPFTREISSLWQLAGLYAVVLVVPAAALAACLRPPGLSRRQALLPG